MRAIRSPTSAAVRSSMSCSASARTAANTSVAVDRIRSGPLRSKPSSAVTWCQPLPTSPSTSPSATNASSNVTSLKWCSPFISWIGLIVIPAASVGTMNWLKPAWRCCGIERAGPRQHHDLVCEVRAAGPHLGAVEQPAAVGRDRAGLDRGEVGARAVLAHPDRRVQLARGDAGQHPTPLLLAAVREQAGCHLTVGDPVRGDGCAVRQQLLGHHIAMQVSESVPAVLGGDGEADEPGVGEPGGEVGVPVREPASRPRVPSRSRRDQRSGSPGSTHAVWPVRRRWRTSASNSLTEHASLVRRSQQELSCPTWRRATILGERDRSRPPRPPARTARRGRRRRQHGRRRHGAQQLRVGVPLLPRGAQADRGAARRIAAPHHARACGLAVAWRRTGVCGCRRRRVVIGGGVLAGVPPHVRGAALEGGRRRVPAARAQRLAFPSAAVSVAGQRRRYEGARHFTADGGARRRRHRIPDQRGRAIVERAVAATRFRPGRWSSNGTAREPSVGAVLGAIVWTKEVWLATIEGRDFPSRESTQPESTTPARLAAHHDDLGNRWSAMVSDYTAEGRLGDTVIDALCDPPESFQLYGIVAHVLTYSAHRRQLARTMLARHGVHTRTGDPLDWMRGN